MKYRSRLLTGLTLVATAFSLVACSASQPSVTEAPMELTIGLTYIPNVQFSPFYVAEKDGLFAETDSLVQLRHHGAKEGLFTALLQGEEDFVVASADELLQVRASGVDLVSICAYYQKSPVTIIVPADSDITEIADLKGRRIGLPLKMGANWFGLQIALSGAGLTEDDVIIQEVGYTQRAALQGGQVDAIVGFSNNELVQFTDSSLALRAIPLLDTDPIPLAGATIITKSETLNEHPEQVKQVINAILEGMRSVAADQENALDVTADYVPGLHEPANRAQAAEILKATVEVMVDSAGKITGYQDIDLWQQMIDAGEKYQIITEKIVATETVTNEYLPQ